MHVHAFRSNRIHSTRRLLDNSDKTLNIYGDKQNTPSHDSSHLTKSHEELTEPCYPLLGKCPLQSFKGKTKDSCLGCRQLKRRSTFRAQYERKKAEVQDKRYEQAEQEAEYLETKTLTDTQIENVLYSLKEKFTSEDGNIDVEMLRIVAREDCGITLGHNRAYRIKKAMKYHHTDDFI